MPASYTPFTMDDGPSLPKPLMTGHIGASRHPSPVPSMASRSPLPAAVPARGPLRSRYHEIAFAVLCCQAQFLSLAAMFQTVAPWLILAEFWDIQDYGVLSWFSAAYSLTAGSFMLPAGRLGDIYGHKRIFMAGWLWFAIWSVAAGFCGPSQLILFSVVRALQGIGPALCIPNAMALIGRTLPIGKKRNLAFAAFGSMGPLGASVGGVFSALLAQTIGWHWEFYILAAWCVVLCIAAWFIVPNPPAAPDAKGKAPQTRGDIEAEAAAEQAADDYMREKQRRFEQDQQDDHVRSKMQSFEQEIQINRQSRRVSSSTLASTLRPVSVYIGGQSYVAFPTVEEEHPSPVSPVLLARPPPFAPGIDRLPSPPPGVSLAAPMSPHVPGPPPPAKVIFDWGGAITGVLGLVLVNFAINEAPLSGWAQAYIVGPLLLGILSLALFAYIELQPGTTHPLVPLRDLNLNAVFTLSCIFVGWSSHGIWIYDLYIWLEHYRHLRPLEAAVQIFPVAITGTIFALSVPHLMKKFNVSIVMFAAMTFFLLGSVLVAPMPVRQTYWLNTFISVIIMPGAMNLSFPAATILLSTTLPPEKQGIAASLVATMVNYSISCGLGLAGTVGETVSKNRAKELGLSGPLPPLTVTNATLEDVRLAGIRASLWFAVALSALGMFIAAIFFHLYRVEQARKQTSSSSEKATEEARQQEEAERKGLLGSNSIPLASNANYHFLRRDSVLAGLGANSGLPKTFSMGGTTVMSLGSNGTYFMKDLRDESDADTTTLHDGL